MLKKDQIRALPDAAKALPAGDQIVAFIANQRDEVAALIAEVLHTSVDATPQEKAVFLTSMHSNLDWACQHADQCVHLVYLRAQRIVGVILVKDYWNLCALMVQPSLHGGGIGAGLLARALALCRLHAPDGTVRLNSSRNAVGFYLAQGFTANPVAAEVLRTTPMHIRFCSAPPSVDRADQ